jgi:hypothetical protein
LLLVAALLLWLVTGRFRSRRLRSNWLRNLTVHLGVFGG